MQQWTIDDLIDHWTLLPSEREQLANKTGATRLGFAVMLKAFALEGRFPSTIHDSAPAVVTYLAQQVDIAPDLYQHYDWRGRSSSNHRTQIRAFYAFREWTGSDDMSGSWEEILPQRPVSTMQKRDSISGIVMAEVVSARSNNPTT